MIQITVACSIVKFFKRYFKRGSIWLKKKPKLGVFLGTSLSYIPNILTNVNDSKASSDSKEIHCFCRHTFQDMV
jgi:hypothetical protein